MLSPGHLEAGGDEFEIEMVVLSLVDDGRILLRRSSTRRRPPPPLRASRRSARRPSPSAFRRLFKERDFDALAHCYAEDWETVDRRRFGRAETGRRGSRGGALGSMSSRTARRCSRCAPESTSTWPSWRAVAATPPLGGGAAEYTFINVATTSDGRIAHEEFSDADTGRPRSRGWPS